LDGGRGEEREAEEIEFGECGAERGLFGGGTLDSAVGDCDEKEENGDGAANGEVDVEACNWSGPRIL
jgi:hypothetical protein